MSGSIKIRGVKRRNRPPSESRTGVRGRRLDVRDVDVDYFDPTDFDAPLFCPPSQKPPLGPNARAGRNRGGTFTLAYGVATQGRAASVKTPITVRAKLLDGRARTSACKASRPARLPLYSISVSRYGLTGSLRVSAANPLRVLLGTKCARPGGEPVGGRHERHDVRARYALRTDARMGQGSTKIRGVKRRDRLRSEGRASVRGRRLDVQPSMSATLTPRILVLPHHRHRFSTGLVGGARSASGFVTGPLMVSTL